MSGYDKVRVGKLKLKGAAGLGISAKGPTTKKRTKIQSDEVVSANDKLSEDDVADHAGWWKTEQLSQILGMIAIECGPRTYLRAVDNGTLRIGNMHERGEAPDDTEIFTAVRTGDTKVALKTGFGKYVAIVPASGSVTATSDAISSVEQFEAVIEGAEVAFQAVNGCFLTFSSQQDAEQVSEVSAKSTRADVNERVCVRSHADRDAEKKLKISSDAVKAYGSLKKAELAHVNLAQSFQDKKIKLNATDRQDLKQAYKDGSLREAMLDRRIKMKADKFCK